MNRKGFTLIEVLITLVTLAVALLDITAMQITAIRGNHFSGYPWNLFKPALAQSGGM